MTDDMLAPSEPIRVAFLARSLEATGGAEQQLAHLALGLSSPRFETRVFCFYETGELCRRIRAGGVPIESLHKRSRWDLLRPVLRLRQRLASYKPHILHSFLGPPNVLAALLKPVLPQTRIVWGVRASDMRLENYDWTRRATFQAEILLSRIPDAIVANADAGREHVMASGFRGRKLQVLPNGIDTQRFAPNMTARRAVRAQFGIAPETPVVGIIARIDPQKDHATFLRAARYAATRRPDVTFLCVGGGSPQLEAELQGMSAQLGLEKRILWLGERKDIAELINAFDLLTLTSAYGEGFPNAVGEAMACGCPCIVTDVGDCAAIVGETGFVAARGDDRALAEHWLSFLALPASARQEFGRQARYRIENHYSLAAMLQHSERLYGTVIGAQNAA
jgi:glycosyltransferase involved in cell wall biosynthesis